MIAVGKCVEIRAWSSGHYVVTIEEINEDGIQGAYTSLLSYVSFNCGFFPWAQVKSIKALNEGFSHDS